MQVIAKANFVRMSPKRLRVIADLVRGLTVVNAENQLVHLRRKASRPMLKLLQSATANAEQNFDCMKENLYIKTVTVNGGPMLKRWTPRAFGRATPIRKRSAHVLFVLDEQEEGKRGGRVRREEVRAQSPKAQKRTAKKAHEEHDHAHDERHGATEEHKKEVSAPGRVSARHHVEGAKVKGAGTQAGKIKRLFSRKAGSK